MDAFSPLKSIVNGKKPKIIATINTSILPYEAEFIADPFIVENQGDVHIFCETFVRKGDKRISHLRSRGDYSNWEFVADIIVGLNLSFPAIYKKESKSEILIIPQITHTQEVIAYSYDLEKLGGAKEEWRVNLGAETHDLLIVNNPNEAQKYLIFASRTVSKPFKRAGLYAAAFSSVLNKTPVLGKKKVIVRKGLKTWIAKLFNQNRLSFRPGGAILLENEKGFVIPLQAKKKGMYGEMLAFAMIDWNHWKLKTLAYVSGADFSDDFQKVHHISWTNSDLLSQVVYCIDFVKKDGKSSWELAIVIPQD